VPERNRVNVTSIARPAWAPDAGLPCISGAPAFEDSESRLPRGWWLIPVSLVGAAIWAVLAWVVLVVLS